MLQRIRDFTVAVLVLAAAFAVVTVIDERVPQMLKDTVADVTSGAIVRPGTELGNVVAAMSANPAFGNYIVVAMLGAAVVLFLLMVRT